MEREKSDYRRSINRGIIIAINTKYKGFADGEFTVYPK